MKNERQNVFARRLRAILAGLALTGVAGITATSTAACGSVQADRCEQVCGCENCGERALTECETKVEANYDIAGAYGCTELLELYWECELQKSECVDGTYSDDPKECEHEDKEYKACLEAQSSLEPPYSGPDQ